MHCTLTYRQPVTVKTTAKKVSPGYCKIPYSNILYFIYGNVQATSSLYIVKTTGNVLRCVIQLDRICHLPHFFKPRYMKLPRFVLTHTKTLTLTTQYFPPNVNAATESYPNR